MPGVAQLVVVVGPTASGKSDLAVDLCRTTGGEVVNADSMQLYRGMDVGTAKLTVAERRGVPHHLLDVLDVPEPASVAVFQQWGRAAVDDCLRRGTSPVLVGGSSLYVRAVLDPLDFPGTDPVVRRRWTERLEAEGPAALHAELVRVAPDAAAAILPSNGRRVVRALEVTEITGSPFVATMPAPESVYGDVTIVGLDVPREVLDARIETRVELMFERGLVEEVQALREHGLDEAPTASRALGYAQVLAMLRGECTEAEARTATARGTRAFARRQDRLFRKDPRIHWLASDSPTHLSDALALLHP